MKKILLLPGVAAAVALISAGCGPDLAQGTYGAEEKMWQEVISDSYSGYRPPRIAPPATADKASSEALERSRTTKPAAELPAPAAEKNIEEKAAADVDKAAAKTDDKKADEKKADAKADDKKADEKKADAKADAKTDAKADDKKADEKKADAKADDKKADEKKADAKKADASSDYEIYVVKAGDTPGSIAKQFYGKASMYDIILKANPQIKDVKLIQIGTELKVPKL